MSLFLATTVFGELLFKFIRVLAKNKLIQEMLGRISRGLVWSWSI
jgi:hypothetical protein